MCKLQLIKRDERIPIIKSIAMEHWNLEVGPIIYFVERESLTVSSFGKYQNV